MNQGIIRVYYGEGRGKSTAALGDGIRAAGDGKNVIMIQFLKGESDSTEKEILDRLEPEIKRFRFAKSECCFDDLAPEEQREEGVNLLNAFHYGQKVVSTGEASFVIFDEILGLLDRGMITIEDIKGLIKVQPFDTTIIFTGRVLTDEIRDLADEVYHIIAEK